MDNAPRDEAAKEPSSRAGDRLPPAVFVVVMFGVMAAARVWDSVLPAASDLKALPDVVALTAFLPASIAAVATHQARQGDFQLRAWLPFGITPRIFAATLLLWLGTNLLTFGLAQLSLDPSTWETLSTLSWDEVHQPVDAVEAISTAALVVLGVTAFEGIFWRTCELAWSGRSTFVAVVLVTLLLDPMETAWYGAIGIVISTALRWVSGSLAGPLLLGLLSVAATFATQAYPLLTPRVGPMLGMAGVGCLAGGALLAWSARR